MKKICIFLFTLLLAITCNGFREVNAQTPTINNCYSSYLWNVPDNSHFGNVRHYQYGIGSYVQACSRSGWFVWDKEYISLPHLYFVVYKYDYPVNLRVKWYQEYYEYLTPNSTYTYQTTETAGTENSYENSVATELKSKINYHQELQGSIPMFGTAKVSINQEIESKIKTEVKTTKTTYASNTTTITRTINAGNEGGYYSYESRANFYLYITQVYLVQYHITCTRDNTWYQNLRYYYTESSYQLLEQTAKYTYIEDSLASGFYKYELLTNGIFVYDDIKVGNIVYY